MTKAELRRVIEYYDDVVFDRAMKGKISAATAARLNAKLGEWARQLTRVTLRNGSAIRYNEEAAK